MEADRGTMSEAEKTQFVLGVYFRTQAAIERFMGVDGLPQWTEHVASINAEAARARVPDAAGRARDLLTGLESMLEVYGSDTSRTETSDRSQLTVRRCGIYDYRERAQRQGVRLTLRRPCEFCVDLHHRTAGHLGVTVEHVLAERGCEWISHIPSGEPEGSGS